MTITEEVTLDDVLQRAKVSLDAYANALATSQSGRRIILSRRPHESNVNQYSTAILRAWHANLDIQYIVDVHACVMYVASYMMKSEKGMSELLKRAAKEHQMEKIKTQL